MSESQSNLAKVMDDLGVDAARVSQESGLAAEVMREIVAGRMWTEWEREVLDATLNRLAGWKPGLARIPL